MSSKYYSIFSHLIPPVQLLQHIPLNKINHFASTTSNQQLASNSNYINLFYPASPYSHKNHLILNSLDHTKLPFIKAISLTINQTDIPSLSCHYAHYLGHLSHTDTMLYYQKLMHSLFCQRRISWFTID